MPPASLDELLFALEIQAGSVVSSILVTMHVLFLLFPHLLLLLRVELQRVLAEVTDHMEQQYSAHQYLEKLRSENESLALKEKERQVGDYSVLAVNNTNIALTGQISSIFFPKIANLKGELRHKKLELKQEKLQVESLELEARYLRSRHKEHNM